MGTLTLIAFAGVTYSLLRAVTSADGMETATWVLAASTVALVLATVFLGMAAIMQGRRLLAWEEKQETRRGIADLLAQHFQTLAWATAATNSYREGPEGLEAILRMGGYTLKQFEQQFPELAMPR